MGVYKVLVISYKRGLLQKIFDYEQRKQYIDSVLNKSSFCRGEPYSKYEYSDTIKKYRFCISKGGYGHRFVYLPEFRKLYIYDIDGNRYNWDKESDEDKELINYFENILDELCPPEWNMKKWSVRITADDFINDECEEIDDFGDDLDENEVLLEIPSTLRSPMEQSIIEARFGSQTDEITHETIEDAIFNGKHEELKVFLEKEKYDQKQLVELFHIACKNKHTNCVNTLIQYGIVPDYKALDISTSNSDTHTTRLLLDKNYTLIPTREQIADAAYKWKTHDITSDLLDILLLYFEKVVFKNY